MKINERFHQIDERIAKNNERKRLQSLMHREVENLKFNDAMETRNNRSGRGNKDKYDIIEKHIGMSISINEKKQQSLEHNEKIRYKMAKDRLNRVAELDGAKNVVQKAFKDQISMAAYAPDIIKTKPKKVRKKVDKEEDKTK